MVAAGGNGSTADADRAGHLRMIRSELIDTLASEHPDLRTAEVEAIVDTFFGAITEQLAGGGRVELRGFGSFSVRARNEREGRNPRTGQNVAVPAKHVPHFKSGKELRARINAD